MCRRAYEFELEQFQRNSKHLGGQSPSQKLASTCKSVWAGHKGMGYPYNDNVAKHCDSKSHIYHYISEIGIEVNYEFVALLSQLTCDYLVSGQTVKILRRLAYEFELDQSQRKSTQVGGQTKCKLNVENV